MLKRNIQIILNILCYPLTLLKKIRLYMLFNDIKISKNYCSIIKRHVINTHLINLI